METGARKEKEAHFRHWSFRERGRERERDGERERGHIE